MCLYVSMKSNTYKSDSILSLDIICSILCEHKLRVQIIYDIGGCDQICRIRLCIHRPKKCEIEQIQAFLSYGHNFGSGAQSTIISFRVAILVQYSLI